MARPTVDWEEVFLSAAFEPKRWLDALDTMARHTGASHGQLIGIGEARDIPFNIVTNFGAENVRHFVELDGGSPDVNFRVAANSVHMARGHYDPLLYEKHYEEAIPGLRSRRYVEWCDVIDIPFGCQTNLVADANGIIGFATLRGRRDGKTNAAQRRIFARAAAAARRAVRLQERLEGEQARFLAGMFEAVGITAFLLDGRGRLLAQTSRAEALLRSGDIGLSNRMLEVAGIPYSLERAVRSLVAAEGAPHVRLRADLAPGRPPLFLEGFRLPNLPWSLGTVPRAIIVANASRRDRAGVAGFLTILYGLTPAEGDIAIRLFEGRSRATICAERSVTQETLRSQIKSIYAKTGAENESALMRLLAAIMA